MKKLLIVIAFSLGFATPAFAQKLDSTHKDWSVFTHQGSCYLASAPTKQTGNYKSRGEPYVLVVFRAQDRDEINVSSGYPYRSGSTVEAKIDGKAHKLFTKGENAWAYDAKQDNAMVAAMQKGSRLTIRGTSQRGTWSEDSYSLSGFTAAHKRMKALCK
jgi:invasion protein IalB